MFMQRPLILISRCLFFWSIVFLQDTSFRFTDLKRLRIFGYVIPTTVVSHFLNDYERHGKYTGENLFFTCIYIRGIFGVLFCKINVWILTKINSATASRKQKRRLLSYHFRDVNFFYDPQSDYSNSSQL